MLLKADTILVDFIHLKHQTVKVARHEGSCCKEMLQRHVAATKYLCIAHRDQRHVAGTCSGDLSLSICDNAHCVMLPPL